MSAVIVIGQRLKFGASVPRSNGPHRSRTLLASSLSEHARSWHHLRRRAMSDIWLLFGTTRRFGKGGSRCRKTVSGSIFGRMLRTVRRRCVYRGLKSPCSPSNKDAITYLHRSCTPCTHKIHPRRPESGGAAAQQQNHAMCPTGDRSQSTYRLNLIIDASPNDALVEFDGNVRN